MTGDADVSLFVFEPEESNIKSHGAGPKPRVFTSTSRRPCGHQKPKYQNKTIDQLMSNYLHTDIDFDINLWHDGGMRGFFSHSLIPPTALSVTAPGP